MRAAIVGGGTGGHVIPALAIARELRDQYSAEIIFLGTTRGIETRLVPHAGFKLQLVQVGQLKGVSLGRRARTLADIPRAVFACRRMFTEFRPDVVIGVGGYASGPGMVAALLMRIPTLAFEPNLVPGFANRMVARFVSAAAVHFEQTADHFRNAVVTGVPVRPAFFQIPKKAYSPGSPTLLVFGGSQGARAINQAVTRSLPELMRRLPGLHVIHQTGEREYNEVQAAYAGIKVSSEVHTF